MNITNRVSRHIVLLGHIMAIIVVSAWGSSFLCSKVLMVDGGISPVELFTFRFGLAYLLLLAITFKKIRSNTWRDELQFLICGVCAGSLFFIAENIALQHTTTGNVSLLSSISPIFTAILMAIIYKVRLTYGVMLGSVTAFAGVGCIIFSSGQGFEINPLGDLLALSSAMSWAVYTISVRKLQPNYSGLFITRKIFFYGVLTALPLLFAEVPLATISQHVALIFDFSQPEFLFNLMFLVVLCSVCAYLMWNQVMRALGTVTSNNYLYGQPIVTMVLGYFLLGEHIVLLGYIGCLLVIGGLIVSDKMTR